MKFKPALNLLLFSVQILFWQSTKSSKYLTEQYPIIVFETPLSFALVLSP